MARDFHSLYFQLENIKNLVSKNLLESAKKQVTNYLFFTKTQSLTGLLTKPYLVLLMKPTKSMRN